MQTDSKRKVVFSFPPAASTPMCNWNYLVKPVLQVSWSQEECTWHIGSFDCCFFLSLYLTINCGIFFGGGPFLFLENLVVSLSLSDIRIASFTASHFKFCSHIFPSLQLSLTLYLLGPLLPKRHGLLSSSPTPPPVGCHTVIQSFSHVQLCNPMDSSTPGFPVFHCLQGFAQIHVHWINDAIQPSHPLLPSSPPAFNVSQHQGLFQWLSSSHQWPKYWSFSFSISPSNGYSGLIPLRIDWLDLLAVQGTLKSLLQHHSSKTSILQCSDFFMAQFSHPYMTAGKAIALTRQNFVSKVMPLLFNMVSRFVKAFLPSVFQLHGCGHSPFWSKKKKNKVFYCFHFSPTYLPWSDGTGCCFHVGRNRKVGGVWHSWLPVDGRR